MLKNFKFFILFVILIIIVVACDKQNKLDTKHFVVTDSIRIENPLWRFLVIDEGFIGINRYQSRIELLNMDGDILDTFGEKGKGPYAFINPTYINMYDNTICITDQGNNRLTLLKLDNELKKLNFISTITATFPIIQGIVISNKEILCTSIDKYNIKIVDFNGNIKNEFLLKQKPKRFEEYFIIANNIEDYFMFANVYNKNLEFYKRTDINKFTYISKCMAKVSNKGKSSYSEEGNKKSVSISGIDSIHKSDKYFYLFIDPIVADMLLVEKYDKSGHFVNDIIINTQLSDYASIAIDGSGEIIWLIKDTNENIIYRCEGKNQ